MYVGKKKNTLLSACFLGTELSLNMAGAFLYKKPLDSELKTTLLYKVWPVLFTLMWFPLLHMTTLKVWQFLLDGDWENFLEIMYIYITGIFALNMAVLIQIMSEDFNIVMDLITRRFRTSEEIRVKDITPLMVLWLILTSSYTLYYSGCIHYGDYPIAVWVPFTDNDKEPTNGIFYFIWVYEFFAGIFIFFAFNIWGPFIILSTICIHKELGLMVEEIETFRFLTGNSDKEERSKAKKQFVKVARNTAILRDSTLLKNPSTEDEANMYISQFVQHHEVILR